MFLRTGDDVTHTRDHWAGRAHWAGGRRQVTLHATFADTPLAEALVAQACDGATYRWRVLREASR